MQRGNIKSEMKKEDKKINNISKIVVSVGVGKARQQNAQFDDKVLPDIISELSAIVGQRPAVRKAKKSVAGFKVRQNDIVGVVATIRGKRKDDFFEKIANVVLPRVRDFKGIDEKKVDGAGNLSIGFKDQFVFPETDPETSKVSFGIEVTMVVEGLNRSEAIDFYKEKGIPLVTV
ncbi:MAG: 50S ribosomal protein L5 [Candidatus Colwellbacteria bacterium]|jgi:large subunit ribosomal protein L5|nr:50S ribosomal protein L5 [Candidatus Colwellbacteria bacterium]MDD4818782.1 50S ribosomal protein L5 [Candidatus Colwellbacteria bacterium]